MIINSVKARKILNSRGEDVIEVIVESDIGSGKGSVGRGKSKGKYEVEEFVKGVDYAVDFLNKFEKLDGVKIEKFEDFEKVEDILGKYERLGLDELNDVGDNAVFRSSRDKEIGLEHSVRSGLSYDLEIGRDLDLSKLDEMENVIL